MSLPDKSRAAGKSTLCGTVRKSQGAHGSSLHVRNPPGGGAMKRLQWCAVLAVIWLALNGLALGQASSSSVRGTVTDQSGGVLPGATVVIANNESKITRTATTGEAGDYRFLSLPPGTYTLSVTASGFARYEQTGLQLLVDTPATANVQLR